MDVQDTDRIWGLWANGCERLPEKVIRAAAREVLAYLDTAGPERLVPLMTRCRALPEMIAAIRLSHQPTWKPDRLTRAPRDVRYAFNEIRRAAASCS